MSDNPILLVIFAGFAIWIWALGLGRARVRGVRDERDAWLSRLFFGAMALVTGVVFVMSSDGAFRLIGAGMALGGVQLVRTARRLALTDESNEVALSDALTDEVAGPRAWSREAIDVHPRLGWTVFIVLAGIGTVALLVVASMEIWDDLPSLGWGVAGVAVFGLVLLLIPVGAAWWLIRVLRRKPFLRIDDWGVIIGNDRSRDTAIRWDEIARIEGRWVASSGYRDVLILIHPVPDAQLEQRSGPLTRLSLRLSRVMYGAPIAISTTTLAMPREEVIARLAAYHPQLRKSGEGHGHLPRDHR